MPGPWSVQYDLSDIDDLQDGTETIKCVLKRDAVSKNSQIAIKADVVQHFYAGFNVWESDQAEQRVTGASSGKLEIKLFEDAVATTDFAVGLK